MLIPGGYIICRYLCDSDVQAHACAMKKMPDQQKKSDTPNHYYYKASNYIQNRTWKLDKCDSTLVDVPLLAAALGNHVSGFGL